MCYKGKCFICIPVENGCLVFAVLSAIFTGLALLASVISGLLTIAGVIFVHEVPRTRTYINHRFNNYDWPGQDEDVVEAVTTTVVVAGIAVGILIGLVALASLIAFIFSVLLCNGICNRRPGQVKAYFIYGVVITVLAVLASVLQLSFDNIPAVGLASLLGCVIYSLFLVLVHQTYDKLRDNAIFKDHVRLVES